MTRRICVVTAGHLSTCPRMLKAADAFHEEGYRVRVISTRTTGWATAADADIAALRDWQWRVVNYDRAEAPATWLRSGARHKAARALAALVNPVPRTVAAAAFGRVHRELVNAILEEPADLIYGGTTGAIAATGYDGYTGIIPKSAGTVSEILRQNGYATAWIGKKTQHAGVGNQRSWSVRSLAKRARIRLFLRLQLRRHESVRTRPL